MLPVGHRRRRVVVRNAFVVRAHRIGGNVACTSALYAGVPVLINDIFSRGGKRIERMSEKERRWRRCRAAQRDDSRRRICAYRTRCVVSAHIDFLCTYLIT